MGYEFRFGGEIYQEDGIEYLVEMEPETFDVCNHELTDYSKESYRPISYSGSDFVIENLSTIYSIFNKMCEERKGHMIVPVSSVIKEINNLKSVAPEGEEAPELYEDRVRWFQYWANKCIRLYSDAAKFSVS